MKRRNLAAVMAVLMAAASFAGCQTNTKKETTAVKTTEAKAATTEAAATEAAATEAATTEAAVTEAAQAENTVDGSGHKVALLLTSTINDAGWSESSYRGMKQAEEEFGFESYYTEGMELVDMETAMRDYIDQGCDIIVLSSADFYQTGIQVAPDYPEVRFVMINGNDCQEPNLANFRPNTPECGFIAGAFAGLMSESGKVGMIGGKSAQPVVDAMNGFIAGAGYTNEKAEVLSNYIDSWTDINKGSEATIAMIESGADVVCANTSQAAMGTISAAQNKGICAVGYIDDQYEVAPGTVPFSALQDVGAVVYQGIKASLQEEYVIETRVLGAAEGVISLSAFYDFNGEAVSEEIQAKMQEIYEGIVDGSLKEAGILPKSSFEK